MKTTLIHLLGGITKSENRVNQINAMEIGEYHAYLTMRHFAEQLNGIPAEEWANSMYTQITGTIKRLENPDAQPPEAPAKSSITPPPSDNSDNKPMTHDEALHLLDTILYSENTTWQEKKNRIADILFYLSNRNLESS